MLCCWFVQIDPIESVKVQENRRKKKRQHFQLEDNTDSIRICMWGESTNQCKGLSAGDVIKVTNMKINQYFENVSLNSTASTRLHKVAAVTSCSADVVLEMCLLENSKMSLIV